MCISGEVLYDQADVGANRGRPDASENKTKGGWDQACYVEKLQEKQSHKTGREWEAMDWNKYKSFHMDKDRGDDVLTLTQTRRAWMNDLTKSDSYKDTFFNKKTQKDEERDFVWVNVRGPLRQKWDSSSSSKVAEKRQHLDKPCTFAWLGVLPL